MDRKESWILPNHPTSLVPILHGHLHVALPRHIEVVVLVDRYAGAVGLAGYCITSTLIAIIPMIIDRGEVHIFFNGSTWGGRASLERAP